jgi:hypothetical protein
VPGPVDPAGPADWAERTLRDLTLRQKVAQLLMPRIGGD